jgi:hypothetical protein
MPNFTFGTVPETEFAKTFLQTMKTEFLQQHPTSYNENPALIQQYLSPKKRIE